MDKNRSMVDVAYELMSKKKKAVNFYKLWQEVSEVKGFDEEEKDDRAGRILHRRDDRLEPRGVPGHFRMPSGEPCDVFQRGEDARARRKRGDARPSRSGQP